MKTVKTEVSKVNKVKQKQCAERRINLLKNQTNSELFFQGILDGFAIKYLPQKGFIAGSGFYIVDFYLPKPFKICIEIDGEIHNTVQCKGKDMRKDAYLTKEREFKVVRIKNKDVKFLPKTKEEFIDFLRRS